VEGKKVGIVGGGLCGSLLALRLAMRGCDVHLFEKREDLRKEEQTAGRSINLALSSRGLRALRMVGLEEQALELCIPMKGRMIHNPDGSKRLSPYSGRKGDYINSVGRTALNALLLDAAEESLRISVYFNSAVKHVDINKANITLESGESHQFDSVFGTDGVASKVRESLEQQLGKDFQSSIDFLDHGYKELSIPPSASGEWQLEKNALHIWPRGGFMLIALPNTDGSFTTTLFLSNKGENSFETLNSKDSINDFFLEHFANVKPLLSNLHQEFEDNPVGLLGTITCRPWHHKDKVLLLGDACHAIVPFYGQGMNSSFEDVRVLDFSVHKFINTEMIFNDYVKKRRTDTDAIAALAIENYTEMRDQVAQPNFVEKRKLEMQLESKYSDYYSKYSMVTFLEELPYSEAMLRGNKQDELLLKKVGSMAASDIDLDELYNELKS